jgi:hypothetical protein
LQLNQKGKRVPRGRPRKYLYFDEIVLETLRNLPPTVTEFGKLTDYAPVSNLRREPRIDANGLKARRSTGARKWESWVDVQTITFEKEIGRFGKF